jgi:hypothetical protein
MTQNSVRLPVSCEPHTIWRLDEGDRPVAAIALFRQCAEQFRDAVDRDDAGAAQDMAIYALGSVAGLFPDPNDSAHGLLQSLVGMIVAAKAGRSKHILQRSTSPILGTKGGFGHALVGGFAISAVQVLTSRNLLSDRQARIRVARLLAEFGCSLRRGDHSEPKPISDAAIRNWRDRPQDYPLHNAMAAEMASVHTMNLGRRNAITLDDVLAYLRHHAEDTVRLSRAY